MATVKILQPNRDHTGQNAMPATFAAFGTAEGEEVRTVRAELAGPSGPVDPNKIRLLRFVGYSRPPRDRPGRGPGHGHGKPARFRYGWVVLCDRVTADTAEQQFTLTVQAVDRRGADAGPPDRVSFGVKVKGGYGVPTVSYPEPGYEIEGGERESFMPFGGSEIAMTDVTLGGVAAEFMAWEPGDNFWYAVMPDLRGLGPGNYFLVAENGDGGKSVGVFVSDS